MGPRFRPIRKSYIDQAKSVEDFLSEDEYKNITAYESIQLILIQNEEQSPDGVSGNSPQFSEQQLEFLRSMDYSTNILIRADFLEKKKEDGTVAHNYSTPHMTIVPEKQAEYKLGNGAFYEFLREEAKKEIDAVDYEKLFPAKLYFTITKEGEVAHLQLKKSSFHPELDQKMIELMQNLPGGWDPAEDQDGNKVEQELVVSFGSVGC